MFIDCLLSWTPLAVLTALAATVTSQLPPWARMWSLTLSLYAGFKWLTWRNALRQMSPLSPAPARSLAYLCLWPGMDGVKFLTSENARLPAAGEWLLAIRNIVAGVAIVWLLAERCIDWQPWIAAWAGLAGIGLLLHFGALGLLSAAWRRAGIEATAIMQRPTLARSLTDFWGRRWNTAFRDLAHQVVYRPLARRWGVRPAMLAVFLFSGLLHDVAISLPARAGYGLPTLYFLMQAAGIEIERSALGRRWRLGGGLRGWAFAAALVLGPAGLLFHAAFLRQVVIPFLNLLGA